MKNFTFLLILINISIYSQPNIYLPKSEDFYSVTNLYMNVIKLEEGELIFYGAGGGILRTYDNGESWHQNYSGTKSYIPKLRYHGNIVYGVTHDGKFMKSYDKGDYWEYQSLSNGFNDIVIHNNSIYLSTFSDTVYVSGDYGQTWSKYKTGLDSIYNISSFNEYLIINNKFNRIYYSDDINNGFEELQKPLNSFYVNNKYDGFYIYSPIQIAELKEDLSWEVYNVNSIQRNFKFIPEENQFTIISSNRSSRVNLGLETYKLDKNTKELYFISKYRNELLNSYDPFYNQEYQAFDVELSNNLYFSSNYFKTILTTENLSDWEINTCNNISSEHRMNVFDNKNMLNIKSGISEILRSSDSGKTFKIKQNIPYDTIDGKELVSKVDNSVFIDKDNGLINLHPNGYFHNGAEDQISKDFVEIKDGKYEFLDITFNNTAEAGYIRNVTVRSHINDRYIIETHNQINTTVPDSLGRYKDSLHIYRYYSYKDNTLNLELKLNSPITFQNLISSKEKIYFSGNIFPEDTTKKGKKFLYSMSKSFENIIEEKEFEFGIRFNGILRDKDNNYVVFNGGSLYFYDKKFNLIKKIETEYDEVLNYTKYNGIYDSYYFSGRPYSDTINGVIFNRFRPFVFYIDNNDEIVEVESTGPIYFYNESLDNSDFMYSVQSRGVYSELLIQIEPEYKNYYLSVIEKPTPPSLWTYPPYPNPVKEKVKMKFFSGVMNDISKLKVELVEISSGKIYKLNEFNIIKTNDYYGEIELDLSYFNSGAYLINFKLGEANKSEAIIIE